MINEITLIYKIEKNKNRIRIFGEIFVNNNKDKCYIKYKDKKYELDIYFLKTNIEEKDNLLELKLIQTANFTNISYMFYNCFSLFSIPDIDNLKINDVIDLNYMFYFCK